jgi:zinc protease
MCAAALAFVIALIASGAAAAADAGTLQTFTLANGLRVYVERMPAHGEAVIKGSVDLSPGLDPPGKAGTGTIATMLLPSLSLHGPAYTLPAMLAAMARGISAPQPSADAFGQAVAEREAFDKASALDPNHSAAQAFNTALFGGPNDPRIVRDTERSLEAITLADVRAYDARYITPQRTTLIIAGDIDPAATEGIVTTALGSWPAGPAVPPISFPSPRPPFNTIWIVPGPDATVHLQIGQTTLGRDNPSFYALNLINAVLSARLAQRLPGAHSALQTTHGRGILAISADLAPANVDTARSIITGEVARLRSMPVPAAEWNAARARLLTSPAVTDPSVAAEIARIQRIAENHLPLTYYSQLATVYAATPQDGLRAARTYLSDVFAEVMSAPVREGPPGRVHP